MKTFCLSESLFSVWNSHMKTFFCEGVFSWNQSFCVSSWKHSSLEKSRVFRFLDSFCFLSITKKFLFSEIKIVFGVETFFSEKVLYFLK